MLGVWCEYWFEKPMSRKMAKTVSPRAWWVAQTIVAVLMLTFCGAALAAPPHTVPNSGASHNCVATSSGVLFFREHGGGLGQDVNKFAPHGDQGEWVQEELQRTC
jgi:hypothetical protein